ncbi:MAG: domain containing protein [Chloroflexi bacterium]|nr:domain containing protein [Chloroflexota bacterium]
MALDAAMASRLLRPELRIINVGLAMFVEAPEAHGARVAALDWRPPAEGDRATGLALARLEDDDRDPIGRTVAAANAIAVERLLAAQPLLTDVRPARDALGLGERQLLHAGPPIAWDRMCGPVRGAIVGAILFEGWAADPAAAETLAASGAIEFAPCHHRGAVGPMAGIVSPSMPVVVVDNAAGGTRAYATLNEGLGKVLRFGAYDASVLERLAWFRDVLGPSLSVALRTSGPIDLRTLTGQALQMGDEGHNRNMAATSLLVRALAPSIVRSVDSATAVAVLDFLRGNDHFFLNLSMAACKSALDAAHGIPGSSVVTAMSRNGVDFGIRISGTGDRWFTAPVGVPDGLFFPGYGPQDANPDLGDSAITETFGIGGFAMAAAPAIVRFVGGSASDALEFTRLMGRITLAKNPSYALPSLEFAGTPTGIDARRVVDSGIAPVINTGIAHRLAGVGQIGAGIARAPLSCFAEGIRELAATLGVPA